MSEELMIVRPFAFYVQDKEIVNGLELRHGAYDMVLQVWVDGVKVEISSEMADRTRRLTSTRITGNPPGLDRKWEGSDIE